MTCPFANFHSELTPSKTVSNEKLSYEIYDIEADILKMTKRLEGMRKKRKDLEMKNRRQIMGTVENVEKEFNKIFGVESTPWRHQRHLACLKPLITSIVYTLKNLETRLDEGKIHVHSENMPLKFTKLPEERLPRRRSAPESLSPPPPPPCEGDCPPNEMDKIWSAHEFEIGDEKLVSEVLGTLSDHICDQGKGPGEFNPKDKTTFCSDKTNDSFIN